MGMTHILYIFEDGLQPKPNKENEMKAAIGEAVLVVCMDPQYAYTGKGQERVNSHAVLNHGNCVNWADQVHSTDEKIYVWSGNRLRPLESLDHVERKGAKRLFEATLARLS